MHVFQIMNFLNDCLAGRPVHLRVIDDSGCEREYEICAVIDGTADDDSVIVLDGGREVTSV